MRLNLRISTLLTITFVILTGLTSTPLAKAGDAGLLTDLPTKGGNVDVGADSIEFIGKNILLKGHVVIRYKEIKVIADKAIVNMSTKDIEATGNVIFVRRSHKEKELDQRQLDKLMENPNVKITVLGYVTKATGQQKILVEVTQDIDMLKTDRVTGNLQSGVLQFGRYTCKVGSLFCIGDSAERDPEGVVTIRNAKMTTCEYIMDDHEHYSITASEVKIYPKGHAGTFQWYNVFPWEKVDISDPSDLENYKGDQSDHSVWAYNCAVNIGDVPVFWSPVLYKPQEPGSFGLQLKAGYNTDWGAFALLSKNFQILDNPDTQARVFFDLYSKRGIGSGAEVQMKTPDSYTNIFGYGIKDQNPYSIYGPSDKGEKSAKHQDRLKIHKWRGELKLSHMHHITPRLDFRGQLDLLSDINFLEDYFKERADDDPQPATFASLERQFDRFTLTALVRPRVNDFFSVVESLPEIRIDIPRQELFKNIYYQGATNFKYLRMKWRDYDRHRTAGNGIDPKDYESIRIDSLHMFYYPFKIKWLNLIPRAGIRLTGYGKSSKKSISSEDLQTMFNVDSPDGNPEGDVVNYDSKGHSKFRIVGEIGIEANTKIYKSWQNVKSPFWELDGLRHVMVPYVNYNYIPQPSVKRKKLYYFDDVDRIEGQNFVRVGLKQHLQTRRGSFGKEEIYQWASLENYYDFHIEKKDGFKNSGDFGTKLSFTPFPKLNISSTLLIDTGMSGESDHLHDEKAFGDSHSRGKGIIGKALNRWETTASYQIMEGLKVFARHYYQDNYRQRAVYSMGSSLLNFTSGSSFERTFSRRHTVAAGFQFPVPFDNNKSHISIEAEYDLDAKYLRSNKIKIARTFHCWEMAVELAQKRNRDYKGSKQTKNSIMFMLTLTQFPGEGLNLRGGR